MSSALSTIQEQIQAAVASQKENILPTGGRINTKGKVFTLPDGTVINKPLELIVLDYRFNNTYYQATWDGQSANRPDCYATGATNDALAPSADVKDPVSEDCTTCPMNAWGSAANGRGGKACQNKVRLAVVTGDADLTSPIFTLDLTPTALKSFGSYMDNANKAGVLPINLLTEVSFVEAATYPTLRMKALEKNDDNLKLWSLRERAQNLL